MEAGDSFVTSTPCGMKLACEWLDLVQAGCCTAALIGTSGHAPRTDGSDPGQ